MQSSAFAAGACALALLFAAGAAQSATITNTFTADNEGWSYGSVGPTAVVSGPAIWNPGGYLSTEDVADEVAFFAPGAYLGDKSSFYGGTLSFDITDAFNDGAPYAALILYGAGQAITIGHAPPSKTGFETFTFNLTEAGFLTYNSGGLLNGSAVSQAQFKTVLGGLTGFAIHADWNTGSDTTLLDNVVLNYTPMAAIDEPEMPVGFGVPEPTTWAMMIAGFGLAGTTLRRRRALAA